MKPQGFSLVELSIVLIIIALFIAGVSAGTSLIKQTKLNAIINETTNYRTAVSTFIYTYKAFPGDFKDAYTYWGSLPNANCTNHDINSDITGCNGSGNDSEYNDWYPQNILAWKHLSFAGLISGTYKVNQTRDTVIGVNVPASKYDNAGYHLIPWIGIQLEIGAYKSGDRPATNVFTASEALNIDVKMDDGVPNNGLVQVVAGYIPGSSLWQEICSNGTEKYQVQVSGLICRLSWVKFNTYLDH